MNIKLHKNAHITSAVRADIASSTERVCVLAKRYGVTGATVYSWRARQSCHANFAWMLSTPHR